MKTTPLFLFSFLLGGNTALQAPAFGQAAAPLERTVPIAMLRPSPTMEAMPTSGRYAPPPAIISAAIAKPTNVEVKGTAPSDQISVSQAKARDIEATAGTYGDFTRYLQIFPGVVFNSDESNDVLVRGGNPLENLYLVDGFEIQNINHITSQATTGGFTSMISTASIRDVQMLSGGYGASYDERLSSVIRVAPRELQEGATSHGEFEAGYVGAGGVVQHSLPGDGALLLAAHRSLLNMVTNDIGLNGVPTFTNGMAQASWNLSPSNQFTALSLNGADSININPCSEDPIETNMTQTQYGGWRTTNGMRWTRTPSPRWTSSLTVSDGEQNESVGQQEQLLTVLTPCGQTQTAPYPTVYQEQTHDRTSLVQYDTTNQLSSLAVVSAGSMVKQLGIDYNVAQPLGSSSPFSADPEQSDATSFAPNTTSLETGSYAEISIHPRAGLNLVAGGRAQTFALDHSMSMTPRLRGSLRLARHQTLHAAYGRYAQLPPSIYLFAFPGNRDLKPIDATHLIAGADLWQSESARIAVEAYRKQYANYPVSTEYPQLSLANMVDTLGQQFVWLPMSSQGRGLVQGVELSAEGRVGSTLVAQANAAYARSQYTGLDGVYHPGNFDFPFVMNAAAVWRPSEHYETSARYEYTTGRPYTPFLMGPSLAQNRPIYDASQLNALRGPLYSRLDFQADRRFAWGRGHAYVYAGLQNALNRKNFLGNEWLTRCVYYTGCVAAHGAFVAVNQMPLYPNFGMRYTF